MSNAALAIRAKGLRKAYKIYNHPFDMLREAITGRSHHIERVALDNIDLNLKQGEIVGILGRNGAGKSTLLKVLAGTLERTDGELEVAGRITAILELGTGFHPEYTGRDNIYMGGLCLGMSRREIDAKIADIIEFSELQDYIDQPFKTYSTGMQARLTFSTAISVEPDILIVDEALSVGDARFQMKCFGRLQQLRARRTTILLVSHDINTIIQLCDRALILENGKIYAQGDVTKIAVSYHHLMFGEQADKTNDETNDETNSEEINEIENNVIVMATDSLTQNATMAESANKQYTLRYGTGEAKLLDWGFTDAQQKPCSIIESGKPFILHMLLQFNVDVSDLSMGFAIKDRRGTVLWGVTNIAQNLPAYHAKTGEKLVISVEGVMWLAAGNYFVNLGAGHLADGQKIDFIEDAIEFTVIGPGGIFTTATVNLQTKFHIHSTQRIQEAVLHE